MVHWYFLIVWFTLKLLTLLSHPTLVAPPPATTNKCSNPLNVPRAHIFASDSRSPSFTDYGNMHKGVPLHWNLFPRPSPPSFVSSKSSKCSVQAFPSMTAPSLHSTTTRRTPCYWRPQSQAPVKSCQAMGWCIWRAAWRARAKWGWDSWDMVWWARDQRFERFRVNYI